MHSEGVERFWGSWNHLYEDSFPGSLWPVILLSLALCPICGLTQVPSRCACTSFSQDGVQLLRVWEAARTYGLAPSVFSDPWGAFLCMCSLGDLLDLKSEKYVAAFSFYLVRAQLLSVFAIIFILNSAVLKGQFQPVASLILCRWKGPWRIFFLLYSICSNLSTMYLNLGSYESVSFPVLSF